ncbi:MAG: undecaprenyldiphospho-muramoylpentapeptide beta-N-acetylglucosaminyltransferase [Bacteroidota bacterium]|jgi:UDP-N-acetylglucosamine--N-acetylmuramyl-(pentapeptide) pyrophosphoryl-undecaprenol N-acetylglucosamine transferase
MEILFAGGGTGGHLYPAIAIAEELLKKDPAATISFVGTKKKIEARVVPQKGFAFYTIWISGFNRQLRLSNLLFPIKVIVSLVQSFFVIQKVKPHVVIGTGGYVCGPVVWVASMLRIPTVIHESNSFPGVTTRLLASKVSKVFITFEVTKKWLPSGVHAEVVGNPTRDELDATTREAGSRFFGLSPEKKTLFVFGGSLGASSINAAMPVLVNDAIARDYQIIWQTGETDWQSAGHIPQHPNIKVLKYVDRMDFGYAAADLIICRSGATTLAELTRLGKPAILVPYPHAAANHQVLNAQTMVESGAASMIVDTELKEKLLSVARTVLFDDIVLKSMKEKSAALGNPDAGRKIAERIMSLIQ